jgi:hypothetical protein
MGRAAVWIDMDETWSIDHREWRYRSKEYQMHVHAVARLCKRDDFEGLLSNFWIAQVPAKAKKGSGGGRQGGGDGESR